MYSQDRNETDTRAEAASYGSSYVLTITANFANNLACTKPFLIRRKPARRAARGMKHSRNLSISHAEGVSHTDSISRGEKQPLLDEVQSGNGVKPGLVPTLLLQEIFV